MLAAIRKSYNHTIYASYVGYITQAIVNNFAPLLFLMAAHVFAALGLMGLAFFPAIMPPFVGVMTAVVLYAIGGGIIEVLISPIVEACPTDAKSAAMSLLHSFYCWGYVFLVVVSTAFFALFGMDSWRILTCIWALVPLMNIFYFMLVPIYPIVAEGTKQLPLRELLSKRVFWLLLVMMVCAGASEQAMSQWSSAFAEGALGVSKTIGDLAPAPSPSSWGRRAPCTVSLRRRSPSRPS